MKLLGWKVTRNTGTEKESSHEVWVGFTDEALAARNCWGFNFYAILRPSLFKLSITR